MESAMTDGRAAAHSTRLDAAKRIGRRLWRFAVHVVRRYSSDSCFRVAASLSYTSLLALVPLIALGLSILTAFPAFQEVRDELQKAIIQNLLPSASQLALDSISSFINNAGSLTAMGVLGLAVVAVMLLSTINDSLNAIWRVTRQRPLHLQILVYWTLVTMGPLLIGASVSLSGYAFAVVRWAGINGSASSPGDLVRLASVPLSTIGFSLLYLVVPNRSVARSHALTGGVVAAVLFELLKYGFGLYLKYFPSYEAIYGAASFVPIFLVWMYMSWAVVLLGAEVAAALPEWRAIFRSDAAIRTSGGLRLSIALAVLRRLYEASRGHRPMPKFGRLVRGMAATPAELDSVLNELGKAGYVAPVGRDRWVLARDPETLTLYDVAQAVDLTYRVGGSHVDEGLYDIMTTIEASERAVMAQSLRDVLDAAHEAELAHQAGQPDEGQPAAAETVQSLSARRGS
jgi:membrane protein